LYLDVYLDKQTMNGLNPEFLSRVSQKKDNLWADKQCNHIDLEIYIIKDIP